MYLMATFLGEYRSMGRYRPDPGILLTGRLGAAHRAVTVDAWDGNMSQRAIFCAAHKKARALGAG